MSKSASSCNFAPDLQIFNSERSLELGREGIPVCGGGETETVDFGAKPYIAGGLQPERERVGKGKLNSHIPDPRGRWTFGNGASE